jgi:BCD family chlorophyll transporter-like MFS transporter
MTTLQNLSWLGIARLGLIQTALGAIIVLTTSTLNRVMVVEMALPAMLPGFLVAVHHFVQLARPRIGYGSDIGGRRTPWILGGMALLAVSGVVAAFGTVLMATSVITGSIVSFFGFFGIGLGSGATGTSLLVLLAKIVAPERKPAAATLVWFMMIAGFAVTAGVAGHYLDPFSPTRLLTVTATVSALAMVVTMLAIRNVEPSSYISQPTVNTEKPAFSVALKKIWQERQARQFTMFVFFSMFAYSFQDLILEPYAGLVFGLSPGASTQLAGTQHAGVLLGMIAVAASGSLFSRHGVRLLRAWTVGGCIASGLVLLALAKGGLNPETWHLSGNVFLLGFANGAFAVAAIATMMTLASAGQSGREGLRMGLWGAAQAIAFALGGFLGTVAVDVCQIWVDVPAHAYGLVFSFEAFMFLVAAWLGLGIGKAEEQEELEKSTPSFGEIAMQEVMAGRN